MRKATPRIAILISGRGSNMEAIAECVRTGRLDAEIALVASDNGTATGLVRARERGLETYIAPYASSRKEGEQALAAKLEEIGVDWIVLAGFMKILSAKFVARFENRIVNIHPSLLPSFRGANGIRDAWEYGVKVTGVTIHLIDEQVDRGHILAQEAVRILPDDTIETLAERIHQTEHALYPRTLSELFKKI